MCVIIYKEKQDELTKQTIKDAWKVNPDGAGYCYYDELDKCFYYRKGVMTLDQLLDELENFKLNELVVHFRIATSGFINARQTHPFLITENLVETKTPNNASKNLNFHKVDKGQALLMHNGIVCGLGTKKHSDTMHLSRLLSSVNNENDRLTWLSLIDGKFVYISDTMGIQLIGDFQLDKETNLMCSNLHHCYTIPKYPNHTVMYDGDIQDVWDFSKDNYSVSASKPKKKSNKYKF